MQIKIKCPNAKCGKTLVVDSEMAGKKGKCSTCDAVFLIPKLPAGTKPGGSTAEVSSASSGEKSAERKKTSSSGSHKSSKRGKPGSKSGEKRSSEKFLDDYVEKPKSSKSKPSRDALDDYSLDEADYVDYEDYETGPPRRNRSSRPERTPGGRDEFYDDYAEADYEDYDDYDDDDRRPRRSRYEEDEYYEEEYYEDPYADPYGTPRRTGGRRKSKSPKLGLVRSGLLIMAIAGCVLAGAMGLKMFLVLLGMLSTSIGSGNTIAIIIKIRELLWLGASIAIIVGYSFLLFFPNKKGSLGLTIAALSLGSVNLLLRIFLLTVPLFSGRGFFGVGMMGLGMFGGSKLEFFLKMGLIEALFIAELVLVALALGAINTGLKDRYNLQMAKRMIIPAGIYGGVLLVMGMFLLILSESPPDPRSAASTIWKWVLYLVQATGDGMLIWYFVSYILLMFNTKNAVPNK